MGFILLAGCAYFNTYYNAQSYFNQGMKTVAHDTLKYDITQFDKTIEKATLVIVKYPQSRWVDEALLLMGVAYYYKGDYPRAREKLDLYCANYPGSRNYAMARYYEGLAHFKEKKYSQAVLALSDALADRRFRKRARMLMCYIHNDQQNYRELVATAEALLKERLKSTEKEEVLGLLGDGQFNLGRYDEALATYQRIIAVSRLAEEKKKLKLKIARILLELNKYEECRSFLAGEHDGEFCVLLASLYRKEGKIPEAKTIYRDIIGEGLAQFMSQAYYELAADYEHNDSTDLAIAYYDSAAMSSGDEYSVKARKRADILKRIMSLSKETENLDRAQFLLAETYFVELADIGEARAMYRKVYSDHPKSRWAPKAYYADFWIAKNVLKDDTLAARIGRELIDRYPTTEYAAGAEKAMIDEH